ncbi:hypothetical protein [uncultured Methanomethylovorans sp.]|uniref:hypothetical protein n=1 Tax=uncultured Methanomethylovorans sp. TaxID=183759 RepID=UPI002AA6B6A0|nr:hypothetical protein [uncultured Methanomethylovorans sp.]
MALKTHSHHVKKNIGAIVAVDSVPLSSKTIKRIAEAKKDIKEGNVCTLEELKAEFGLE